MFLSHHLTNLLFLLSRGIRNFSIENTTTNSVPIITDIVKNIVRLSDDNGLSSYVYFSIV